VAVGAVCSRSGMAVPMDRVNVSESGIRAAKNCEAKRN
jgi:hypothetical protein